MSRFYFVEQKGVLVRAAMLIAAATVTMDGKCWADSSSFRDRILPLLSDRCFACHGPDDAAREADLRLDSAEEATADRGGYFAIKPGNSHQSEVMERITSLIS